MNLPINQWAVTNQGSRYTVKLYTDATELSRMKLSGTCWTLDAEMAEELRESVKGGVVALPFIKLILYVQEYEEIAGGFAFTMDYSRTTVRA